MTNERQIRIGIIGAGSIGSLFGGYIAKSQSDKYQTNVIFFGREEHIEAVNEKGLSLIKENTTEMIDKIKGYVKPKDYLDKMGEKGFHFCFLTTKTYDIEPTLKEYKKIIDKSDWLVILQNGIGNEDLVKEYVPKSRIIRAITSNGAFLVEPGKVEHTGKGFTKIGLPFPNAIEERGEESNKNEDLGLLRKLLTENDIKTTISENIIKDCWEKIFVNIGINPFGALTRLKNGGLMENKDIKTIMGEAVEEATQVANQKGINLSDKNYVNLTYSVARKTQDNVNSMLQDILKGKQTEIDFINGKIVQYAEELGIDVPINRTLTHLIKGLENSSL